MKVLDKHKNVLMTALNEKLRDHRGITIHPEES